MYKYSKLKGLIIERFNSQRLFAKSLGISEKSLSLKLHSKRPWRQSEIERSCDILDIEKEEIGVYFFYLSSSVLNYD